MVWPWAALGYMGRGRGPPILLLLWNAMMQRCEWKSEIKMPAQVLVGVPQAGDLTACLPVGSNGMGGGLIGRWSEGHTYVYARVCTGVWVWESRLMKPPACTHPIGMGSRAEAVWPGPPTAHCPSTHKNVLRPATSCLPPFCIYI